MAEDKKRSAKFLAAEQSLPKELRPVFMQLVDEYQFHAHTKGGFPWVAYNIVAALVRDGWRPPEAKSTTVTFVGDCTAECEACSGAHYVGIVDWEGRLPEGAVMPCPKGSPT